MTHETTTITLQGRLPSLNEYLNAYGKNRYKAGSLKKQATGDVSMQIRQIAAIDYPAKYSFTWYIKDKRTDPDNIASAVKYIFDGFIEAGKLPNDNFAYVTGLEHKFVIDKNEKVVIEIIPS